MLTTNNMVAVTGLKKLKPLQHQLGTSPSERRLQRLRNIYAALQLADRQTQQQQQQRVQPTTTVPPSHSSVINNNNRHLHVLLPQDRPPSSASAAMTTNADRVRQARQLGNHYLRQNTLGITTPDAQRSVGKTAASSASSTASAAAAAIQRGREFGNQMSRRNISSSTQRMQLEQQRNCRRLIDENGVPAAASAAASRSHEYGEYWRLRNRVGVFEQRHVSMMKVYGKEDFLNEYIELLERCWHYESTHTSVQPFAAAKIVELLSELEQDREQTATNSPPLSRGKQEAKPVPKTTAVPKQRTSDSSRSKAARSTSAAGSEASPVRESATKKVPNSPSQKNRALNKFYGHIHAAAEDAQKPPSQTTPKPVSTSSTVVYSESPLQSAVGSFFVEETSLDDRQPKDGDATATTASVDQTIINVMCKTAVLRQPQDVEEELMEELPVTAEEETAAEATVAGGEGPAMIVPETVKTLDLTPVDLSKTAEHPTEQSEPYVVDNRQKQDVRTLPHPQPLQQPINTSDMTDSILVDIVTRCVKDVFGRKVQSRPEDQQPQQQKPQRTPTIFGGELLAAAVGSRQTTPEQLANAQLVAGVRERMRSQFASEE